MTTTAPTLMGIPLAKYAVKRVTTEPAPTPAPAGPIDRVRLALAARRCLELLKDPAVLLALQTLLLLVLSLLLLVANIIGGLA